MDLHDFTDVQQVTPAVNGREQLAFDVDRSSIPVLNPGQYSQERMSRFSMVLSPFGILSGLSLPPFCPYCIYLRRSLLIYRMPFTWYKTLRDPRGYWVVPEIIPDRPAQGTGWHPSCNQPVVLRDVAFFVRMYEFHLNSACT